MAERAVPASITSAVGTQVTEEALPGLLNLLSPVACSWDLFVQQIGVPPTQISQIRAANPQTGTNYLYKCFTQALEWWVANHDNPVHETMIEVLDPEIGKVTPVMNRALANKLREFMAKQRASMFPTPGSVAHHTSPGLHGFESYTHRAEKQLVTQTKTHQTETRVQKYTYQGTQKKRHLQNEPGSRSSGEIICSSKRQKIESMKVATKQMRALNDTHQAEMRAQNETYQAKMRALNETHRAEVERVRTEVAAELNEQNTAAQTQLRGEIQWLEQLAQHRQEEIERSETAHSIEIAETRLQHQVALQTKLRAQTETHQAEMRSQNDKHQAEMRALNEKHQAEVEQVHTVRKAQNEARELERRSLTNELDSLRSEVSRLGGVIDSLQTTISSNTREISTNKVALISKAATLTQKESELASKNAILERQSSTIREQNEQLTRAREFLSGQKPQPHPLHPQAKITWKPCRDLPEGMDEAQTVVIRDRVRDRVYCGGGGSTPSEQYRIFRYNSSENIWNDLPPCDVQFFGLGQVRGKLVTVGGMKSDDSVTNEVQEFDEATNSWEKHSIPPMPTARFSPAVLSHHSTLTVAGGYAHNCISDVEIFKEETSEWYTTDSLLFPCRDLSSILIDNRWYLLGGTAEGEIYSNHAVCAHVDLLLQKALPRDQASTDRDSTNNSAWEDLPNTPLYAPAAATLSTSLLAVGGTTTNRSSKPQAAVHVYSPCTKAWIHISDLPAPLMTAATAILSPTELLVIGGWNGPYYQTKVYKGLLRME